MFFSKLKISTKLIISSAVFLIPVGVMVLLICTTTIEKIRKSSNEIEGISVIESAVTILQYLPEYLNVYLGLRNGNLSFLDEKISDSIKTMERELRQYRTGDRELPDILSEWDALKRIEIHDEELYPQFLNFSRSIKNLLNLIGEYSRLLLVSDMNTYYLISPALSYIPEAFERLMVIAYPFRIHQSRADVLIEQFNDALAVRHANEQNLNTRFIEGDAKSLTLNNLSSMISILALTPDLQTVYNSRPFLESDKDRITLNLKTAIEENIINRRRHTAFEDLSKSLEKFQEAYNILNTQYPAARRGGQRGGGQEARHEITVLEFLETISMAKTALFELWDETFVQLDLLVHRNTRRAQIELAVYLIIVFFTLGIAILFVVFIVKDVNKSVKNLRTLFTGLNENDLTLTLQVTSKDEFGELMTAFNGFLNILRSTFGSFKQSATLVSNSVFDISSASKEITATANEQSTSVSEIVSTMENSKNLSEQIALKTTEVAQLAIQTQELSSKGAELRETNQGMMEDIRRQNQKIISEIRNLSDMIVRISEAIRIIDGIADQTKLIAFNASLEASSSGEAGARFSVVASEIRRFADNVVESTQEIKQKIEDMQAASQILITEANSGSKQIEIGYEGMSEQKVVFEQIVGNSQNVATRSQQISNLSKQQELASSQIFSTLKEISAGVKQFVIATSSTAKIANSLNGMSEELKEKVEKYRTDL